MRFLIVKNKIKLNELWKFVKVCEYNFHENIHELSQKQKQKQSQAPILFKFENYKHRLSQQSIYKFKIIYQISDF